MAFNWCCALAQVPGETSDHELMDEHQEGVQLRPSKSLDVCRFEALDLRPLRCLGAQSHELVRWLRGPEHGRFVPRCEAFSLFKEAEEDAPKAVRPLKGLWSVQEELPVAKKMAKPTALRDWELEAISAERHAGVSGDSARGRGFWD